MSSLGILFIVTLSIIGSLNTVESANNKAADLNTVLNFLQQLKQSSDSTTDSDDNTDDYFTEIDKANNRDEMLEKERIIDLIEKVAKENSNKVQDNNRIEKSDRNQLSQNDKLGDAFDNTVQTQILAKLLSQDMNKEIKTKPRIKPNRLVPTVSVNEVDRNDNVVTGLEDYSKIYVVLNPQAVDRSKNKNAFNELISKILSLSSLTSKKDNQRQRKPRRYKGFLVKEDMPQRRFRQAMANRARRYNQNRQLRRNIGYYPARTAGPSE
ncbi:uncharacterized protein LOC118275002 [Spodoptera frugiperda]|uniref:Uncharacterized protein LOC118275002 n=1 Tax=Spodoptera frugiperda TaxID=7108 RepID=A0A9R0DD29_SPOFR|nr:uncharacterized protein LOC118275002 [Spodoptera frugiperda]